uniref:Uncharacterized protein n=1 Tax=Alexandrium andersonii TaxID=327968 RepID=A0A7S2I6V7_9DINO
MAVLATLALGGVACAAALPSLDDSTVLLQASVRAEDSEFHTPAYASQLKSILDKKELQDAVLQHTGARVDEDLLEDFHDKLMADPSQTLRMTKETKALLKLDARRAVTATKTLPPEVEQVKDDMHAVLRQMVPDPAQASMLLHDPSIGRNFTLPQEQWDRMSERLARMAKSFQANSAVHDELLARIPMLHRLIDEKRFFEPLQDMVANNTVHSNTTLGFKLNNMLLLDRFPRLSSRGAVALRRLRMEAGAGEGSSNAPNYEPLSKGVDPFIHVSSSHGRKWTPEAKTGCGYSLSMGFNKKFFLSQILTLTPDEVSRRVQLVAGVGVSCTQTSGMDISADFHINLEDGDVSPFVSENAVSLRLTPQSPFSTSTATGFKASYITGTEVGTGVESRYDSPHPVPVLEFAKSTSGASLHTFDFDSADSDTAWGGWRYGDRTTFSASADSPDAAASEAAVMSKRIYAPYDYRNYQDVMVRAVATPKH